MLQALGQRFQAKSPVAGGIPPRFYYLRMSGVGHQEALFVNHRQPQRHGRAAGSARAVRPPSALLKTLSSEEGATYGIGADDRAFADRNAILYCRGNLMGRPLGALHVFGRGR